MRSVSHSVCFYYNGWTGGRADKVICVEFVSLLSLYPTGLLSIKSQLLSSLSSHLPLLVPICLFKCYLSVDCVRVHAQRPFSCSFIDAEHLYNRPSLCPPLSHCYSSVLPLIPATCSMIRIYISGLIFVLHVIL